MKRALLTLAAGVALGAAAVAAPALSSPSSGQRYVTISPGDDLVRGVDLACSTFRHDPDHHEAGPVMYCNRYSTTSGRSRALSISLYHYVVTSENGQNIIYKVGRTP
jgi:hypothetical protein